MRDLNFLRTSCILFVFFASIVSAQTVKFEFNWENDLKADVSQTWNGVRGNQKIGYQKGMLVHYKIHTELKNNQIALIPSNAVFDPKILPKSNTAATEEERIRLIELAFSTIQLRPTVVSEDGAFQENNIDESHNLFFQNSSRLFGAVLRELPPMPAELQKPIDPKTLMAIWPKLKFGEAQKDWEIYHKRRNQSDSQLRKRQWSYLVSSWNGLTLEAGRTTTFFKAEEHPYLLPWNEKIPYEYRFRIIREVRCSRIVFQKCHQVELRIIADPKAFADGVWKMLRVGTPDMPRSNVSDFIDFEKTILLTTEAQGLIPHHLSITHFGQERWIQQTEKNSTPDVRSETFTFSYSR
jgi:hypothetical protein